MRDGFILIVRMAIRVLVPVLLALAGVFEIHPIPTVSAALQSLERKVAGVQAIDLR